MFSMKPVTINFFDHLCNALADIAWPQVNPLLYALHAEQPDAFMDVTVGNISCACLGSLNDPEEPQRCCDDNGTAMCAEFEN